MVQFVSFQIGTLFDYGFLNIQCNSPTGVTFFIFPMYFIAWYFRIAKPILLRLNKISIWGQNYPSVLFVFVLSFLAI